MGSRSTALFVFNLNIRCRWVLNFTPRPLYRRLKTFGMGPAGGVGDLATRNISCHCPYLNPESSNQYRSHCTEYVRARSEPGGTREGKWRGNWRMEWVASTLTPPPNVVYPALLKLMRTPQLPAVDWTDVPTDLNGLVRFGERRNLVSAHMPSRSAQAISGFLDKNNTNIWYM